MALEWVGIRVAAFCLAVFAPLVRAGGGCAFAGIGSLFAGACGSVVGCVLAGVVLLAALAGVIGDVLCVVGGFAFALWILGLNFAVDGAGSGAAGGVFWVVGGEVGHLAQRGASGCKGIRLLLRSSLELGWRWSRVGQGAGGTVFVLFMAVVCVSGIVVGVSAVFVVLCLVIGLLNVVVSRMVSVLAQVAVFFAPGSVAAWALAAQAAALKVAVVGFSLCFGVFCLLRFGLVVFGVALGFVCFLLERGVLVIWPLLWAGRLVGVLPGSFVFVVGGAFVWRLGVTSGDEIGLVGPDFFLPAGGLLLFLLPLPLVGVFSLGAFVCARPLVLFSVLEAAVLFLLPAPRWVRVCLRSLHRGPAVAR
ncbi:hypothetical protein [Paraburkholderia steynii]|nr:hypothetical protein [Paraburkholderia steynii]